MEAILLPPPRKPIPDRELLKTLWRGWGGWGGWGGRILSTVIKKKYFSIHFSPKKAFYTLIHNLSIMPKLDVKKDVYKA